MAKKTKKQNDGTAALLKDLLIVELAKVNVPQSEIRDIAGVDMGRVNRIARYFKKRKKDAKTN